MRGGIEETSASFEARSAPRSYPTPGHCVVEGALAMAIMPHEPPKGLRLNDVRVDLKRLFLKLGEVATRAGISAATGTWVAGAGGIITAAFAAADTVFRDTQ